MAALYKNVYIIIIIIIIIIIFITKVLKTTRAGKHIQPLELSHYGVENLCVVRHLHHYVTVTRSLRLPDTRQQLLISYRKPHRAVSTDTISGWIKTTLHAAGIDIQVFGAHSTRGAATSAAARQGAPLDVILRAADWKSVFTFARFYKRDVTSRPGGAFGSAVLGTMKWLYLRLTKEPTTKLLGLTDPFAASRLRSTGLSFVFSIPVFWEFSCRPLGP